ncbi:MAG: cation transporter, partial [Gammaproteobacteria bacterium]
MSAAPEKTETQVESRPFRFKVRGMDCASCATTLERGLAELDGVDDVHVSFTTETIDGRGRVTPE